MRFDAGSWPTLLQALGVEHDVLDSGCCELAGAFGFEASEHYDVSARCGQPVLLPAVRDAGEDLVVADGFSRREWIRQSAGRQAFHLAGGAVRRAPAGRGEGV